jgi:hypothetical protein
MLFFLLGVIIALLIMLVRTSDRMLHTLQRIADKADPRPPGARSE